MIIEAHYCVFLNSNIVSWSSTKPEVVSGSSVEIEYWGLATTIAKIIWIQFVFQELCISQSSPPLVWCDNQSATQLVANPIFHACSKHIKLDVPFIWDKVLQQALFIHYISSKDQMVDIFTKHLPSSKFIVFRTKFYVVPWSLTLMRMIELNDRKRTRVNHWYTISDC